MEGKAVIDCAIQETDIDFKIKKSKSVLFRCTPQDHESMKKIATELGMTVTEYIISLHHALDKKLNP